jgi:hypothetical protein
MMKKIVSLALLGASSSLMAMYAEHAYLYKDPRIMGMGGANVAVGGYSTSVFSNPAGIAQINKEHGFVVDILGIGVSLSGDSIMDVMDDIDNAETDADEIELLSKHSGKNFHFGLDNYSALSKNSDLFAWSIGVLGAADLNLMLHGNGGNGLVETSTRVYGGVNFAAAKPYEIKYGTLDVGVNVKVISQVSYEGTLSISDLLDDDEDLADKMQEKYEKESTGFGIDIGANYHFLQDSGWNPAVGVSILNIGDMSMDDTYGAQPMTVNIGASVTKEDIPVINKVMIAVDYVDLFNANILRMYDYNPVDDTVTYSDYEDSGFIKRLRIGASLGLVDSPMFSTNLNLGLYQGSYTAGLDLELLLLKLNLATYEEQIGTADTDITDRRYVFKLGLGW